MGAAAALLPRPPLGNNGGDMRVSAKADYALRAVIELAGAGDGPVKGERIAQAQEIPLKFLENILGDLRHAGLVRSQRGAEGGYWLARDPDEITVADIVRAVDGPIANVRGLGPEAVEYVGVVAPFGSCRSSTSCGRMNASPSRFTGPTNDITNSFAGES